MEKTTLQFKSRLTTEPVINKPMKICEVCGKPYLYQLKIMYLPGGRKECRHDGDFFHDNLVFSQHEKKLAEKYHKQGKVLVKCNDGLTRVCDYKKKK